MATRFWVQSNESPRAKYFRTDWASKNEGEWKRHGNLGWQWFPAEVKKEVKKEVKAPKKRLFTKSKEK